MNRGDAFSMALIVLLTGQDVTRAANAQTSVPGAAKPVQQGSSSHGAREEGNWPRVLIPDPPTATILRLALDEASRRLDDPGCQAILTDFHDSKGLSLAERLNSLQLNVHSYLGMIVVRDGSQLELCGGTLAYTSPGSRVVYVCSRAIARGWGDNPEHLVASLIHEMLHTLGLGENPPSSIEITNRVRQRCGSHRRRS